MVSGIKDGVLQINYSTFWISGYCGYVKVKVRRTIFPQHPNVGRMESCDTVETERIKTSMMTNMVRVRPDDQPLPLFTLMLYSGVVNTFERRRHLHGTTCIPSNTSNTRLDFDSEPRERRFAKAWPHAPLCATKAATRDLLCRRYGDAIQPFGNVKPGVVHVAKALKRKFFANVNKLIKAWERETFSFVLS
jgi:hypothetical protein